MTRRTVLKLQRRERIFMLSIFRRLNRLEQSKIGGRKVPVSCAFENEPFIFGVGPRNVCLNLGDVDQNYQRLRPISERINRPQLATITILKTIERHQISFTDIVNDAANFFPMGRKNIGSAAVAQARM